MLNIANLTLLLVLSLFLTFLMKNRRVAPVPIKIDKRDRGR
jgi:hypothetical protein